MKIDPAKMMASNPSAAFAEMMGANRKDIQHLLLDQLLPYPDQPFRPYAEEALMELAEDIRLNGILSPVLVRPLDGAYQILAGHNRVNAAKLAGLSTAPCIVKEVGDNDAQLILVNTNLNQRQELLPSEKAFAYKMQLDAMKSPGKRSDLTLSQIETKLNSAAIVARNASDTRAQVMRYIRLTFLRKSFLEQIDAGRMPMMAGVDLSYLPASHQQLLDDFLTAEELRVNLKAAKTIRLLSEESSLTDDSLRAVFYKTTPPKPSPSYLKIRVDRLGAYLPPKMSEQEIEDYVMKAVKFYRERERK